MSPSRPTLAAARRALRAEAVPEDASLHQRFMKTGRGQYAEGDRFIGVRVPAIRRIARAYRDLPLSSILALLKSPLHEERLLALLMMVARYRRADPAARRQIYEAYYTHRRFVNNWDLVDSSAPYIAGPHFASRSRQPLYRLARSRTLWDRRIAIMATFYFIRQHDFEDTFALARLLLEDEEDLIHKAVGWMLREVAQRDRPAAEAFLRRHYRGMPRTMLRYAIEKFPERRRRQYLRGAA